jgi:hypothetical protein
MLRELNLPSNGKIEPISLGFGIAENDRSGNSKQSRSRSFAFQMIVHDDDRTALHAEATTSSACRHLVPKRCK